LRTAYTPGAMLPLLTESQEQVLELAARLAERFAETAAEHDRDNTFPAENWPVMAEAGYLGLTVPRELGGLGGGAAELFLAQERLAQGDGATALAVNMHLTACASLAAGWRRRGDARAERLLRGAATGEIVHASCTSEPGYGGALEDCAATATPVPGGYALRGRKTFFTESDVATHFVTCARLAHATLGPHMVFFNGLPIDAPGLAIVRTWDTLGMRATQSNDLVLEDVFAPEESLFHAYPVGHLDATIGLSVISLNVPSFGAVALGIAAGGMEWARRAVLERGRQHHSEVQHAFARMEILLETARATLFRHAHELASFDRRRRLGVLDVYARGCLAKYVACENAIAIMDRVMEVAGGAGYHRRFPVERLYRDVRAGAIMPYSAADARALLAQAAFGIEPSPVFGYEESEERLALLRRDAGGTGAPKPRRERSGSGRSRDHGSRRRAPPG
jgi:alkylation response protein AidB-like acyl-CoA dehydrogenase